MRVYCRSQTKPFSGLPRQDLLIIVGCLGGVIALAWIYVVGTAADVSMPNMSGMGSFQVWEVSHFFSMFLMWSIMMAGMMLPSATPTVLNVAAGARTSGSHRTRLAPTIAFVSAYLVPWIVFSLAATAAQWGLGELALLSPAMRSSHTELTATLLIVAGGYQWLPIKARTLTRCRALVTSNSGRWAAGPTEAFRIGVVRGIYSVGCCWALMLLLFVGGVMNLLWIAALTLFVLLEHVLPFGATAGRWMGVLMILGGGATVIGW